MLESPWWLSAILAVIFFVVGSFVLPALSFENLIIRAFSNAVQAMTVPVTVGIASISLFSLIRSSMQKRHRTKLFEKQKGMETIKPLSWADFERLIGEYFSRHGYTVAENSKKGADDGVDLRLVKDGKRFIVQCKHWKNHVGVGVVREHLGAITAMGADGGLVVTSGGFTKTAKAFAAENNIGLIDGDELQIYFQSSKTQEIDAGSFETMPKADDPISCPNCGADMMRRQARKGANAGKSFYGCSTFPKCRGIRNI